MLIALIALVLLLQTSCKLTGKKNKKDKQNDSLRVESSSCTDIIFVA